MRPKYHNNSTITSRKIILQSNSLIATLDHTHPKRQSQGSSFLGCISVCMQETKTILTLISILEFYMAWGLHKYFLK